MTVGPVAPGSGFRWLTYAMAVSSTGDWIGVAALATLVARRGGPGGAGWALALVMGARLVAVVAMGPFAGAIVAARPAPRLLVTVDVARAALFVPLPFISPIWGVALVAFAAEGLSLLWTPARDLLIADTVPDDELGSANAIALATSYGTLPAGSLLFVLLATIGTRWDLPGPPETLAIWADAASFLAAAALVGRHLAVTPVRNRPERLRQRVRQGWHDLGAAPTARSALAAAAGAMAILGATLSLAPILLEYGLQRSASAYGWLLTAFAIGGALATATTRRRPLRPATAAAGLAAGGAALVLLAAAHQIALALVAALVLGAAMVTCLLSALRTLQQQPERFRADGLGAFTVVSRGSLLSARAAAPALTGTLAGVLASRSEATASRWGLVVVGVAGLIGAAVLWRRSSGRSATRSP